VTHRVTEEIGGRTLAFETGKVAKQADGAAVVQYGDTIVLVTAVVGDELPNVDFLPLSVDYREKTYAAGKIPGSVFKREGRPTTKEILTMRIIDRPIRPLIPQGFRNEVQVMAIVLAVDKENDPDMLAMNGACAAMAISGIPFDGPVGAVRIGLLDDALVVNPTRSQMEDCRMDLVVAGTKEYVNMVSGGANEVDETTIVDAIALAHEEIKKIVALQETLVQKAGKPKMPLEPVPVNDTLQGLVKARAYEELKSRCRIKDKRQQEKALRELRDALVEEFAPDETSSYTPEEVKTALQKVEKETIREMILSGTRPDGRGLTDIREMECEVAVLPRVHGSALFTRGETQVLVVATLGTKIDEQRIGIDDLAEFGEYTKRFMVHYNFPPFSVGEVRRIGSTSRREVGHGALAESALLPVVPSEDVFPYTIRLVSDVFESNSSSSMATVCGGTLAMMDAGVPINHPVAGIGMGLIKEGGELRVLSDIMGKEDHYGDMDFKVVGTQNGITGMQMDVKIPGVTREILEVALEQAREGRLQILRTMLSTIKRPRESVSAYAPKLARLVINPEKIGMIIGPGGKTIRRIQEETDTKIEIEDDGTVMISGSDLDAVKKAYGIIEGMTEEVVVGKTYTGKVTSVKDFGAFVEILPGQEGLVHVSELSDSYVRKISDVVRMGDEITVKCIGVDDQGKIRLSRKAAIKDAGSR